MTLNFRHEINTLPIGTIMEKDLIDGQGGVNATCTVCLTDFEMREGVKRLPCEGAHHFPLHR